MTRIQLSEIGETNFQKLLGHNVEIMEGWNRLGDAFSKSHGLSGELKEQVRRVLAHENKCNY